MMVLIQSFYGPMGDYFDRMYSMQLFEVDRICLRVCFHGLISSGEDFFETYFSNFFSIVTEHKFGFSAVKPGSFNLSQSDDVDKERFTNVFCDFFLCYNDLFCLEHEVTQVTSRAVFEAYERFANDPIDPSATRFYWPMLEYMLRTICIACCPCKSSELIESLTAISKDDDMIEKFYEENIEVDPKTLMATLKKSVREAFDVKAIDTYFMWTAGDYYNKLLDGWSIHIPKESQDLLNSMPAFTEFSRLLRRELLHTSFYKHLSELISIATKIDRWSKLLRPLLRCILLHVENITTEHFSTDRELVKAAFDYIESALILLPANVKKEPLFRQFSNRFHYLQGLHSNNSKQSIQPEMEDLEMAEKKTSKQVYDDRVKEKFNNKRDKILTRIAGKKKDFFANMNQEAENISRQISSEESNLMCAISREPIAESETYYLIAMAHLQNLKQASELSTIRASIAELMQHENPKVEIDELYDLKKCSKNIGRMLSPNIITACGHIIKNYDKMLLSMDMMVCFENEFSCPLCKAMSNIMVPVYPNLVRQHFLQTSKDEGVHKSELKMSDLISHVKQSHSTETGRFDSALYFQTSRDSSYDQESMSLFAREDKTRQTVIFPLQNANNLFYEMLTNERRESQMTWEHDMFSTVQALLELCDLYGLASSIKSYAKVYHSLYMAYRINSVVTLSDTAAPPNTTFNILGEKLVTIWPFVEELIRSDSKLMEVNLCSVYSYLITTMVRYSLTPAAISHSRDGRICFIR